MSLRQLRFVPDRTAVFVLSDLEPARRLTLLMAVPLLVLSCSGLTAELVFDRTSMLKYALSVAVPLIAVVAALAPQPFLVFVALIVVAGPVATFETDLLGVPFSAVVVLALLTAIPVFLGLSRPIGRTALGTAGIAAALLLAVPVAIGRDVSEALYVPAVIALVAFYCARATVLPGGVSVVLISSVVALTVQAALAIWEYVTEAEFDLYSGLEARPTGYFFDFQGQPRPTGTFFDPISLGTALVPAIPLCLVAVLMLLHHRRRTGALAVSAAMLVIGCGLTLSLSRMATIGALAGIATVLILVPGRLRWPGVLLTGGMLTVLVAVALSIGGPSLFLRATSVADPTANEVVTADGDRDRVDLWHVALDVGLEHPATGVGFGNLNQLLVAHAPAATTDTHAHSAYLQVFAEGGVLGLAAVVVLGVAFARDLARARGRSAALVAGLAGAAVAVCVAAMTDVVVLRYVPVAATLAPLLGITAGLSGRRGTDG